MALGLMHRFIPPQVCPHLAYQHVHRELRAGGLTAESCRDATACGMVKLRRIVGFVSDEKA
jgi:hypothetical protein